MSKWFLAAGPAGAASAAKARPIPAKSSPSFSSLLKRIVDYINSGRREHAESAGKPFPSKGHARLRHASFIKKLEAHPGIHSTEFSGEYTDSSGRKVKCYNLPEREARLMVMSESLEVQTKVLDRLMELERALDEGLSPNSPLARIVAGLPNRGFSLQGFSQALAAFRSDPSQGQGAYKPCLPLLG